MSSRLANWLKQTLWRMSPRIFDLLVPDSHTQTFSIAIYRGASPFCLSDLTENHDSVLSARDVTDVPAGFVADPFMIWRDERWNLFMEVYNKVLRQGQIGLATSVDAKVWRYEGLVLAEPFHTAYPHVFEHADSVWMTPDTPGQGVRLYKADRFPDQWRFEATLVDDPRLIDPTVFEQDGRWWMLAGSRDGTQAVDSLRLFSAPELIGPWKEHPESPVVRGDPRVARPAGAVVRFKGGLYRFAQVGVPVYCASVRAFRIVHLSEAHYREVAVTDTPVLESGVESWRTGGMHHVHAQNAPAGNWIACVDGWHRT